MTRKFIFNIFQFIDRFHWLWLLLVTPFLVFPSPKRSLALLVIPILWWIHGFVNRHRSPVTGRIFFLPVTPLNISLLVLTIMVLVSLWATYSIEQSLEKISGVVLGLGVFFAVVRESKRPSGWPLCLAAFLGGGLGWATLGFLGMNYQVRFSFLVSLISRIPVIIKDLPGAESGLQHNAVGGTILWFLPVFCLMSVYFLKAGIENGKLRMENEGSYPLKKNIVKEKSFAFALRIIKLHRFLQDEKREYVLSKQLLRSGTAIGALVREAEQAESKADFIHKMAIALKEANETDYWIELLYQSETLEEKGFSSIKPDITELIKLLTSIIKTSRDKERAI